MIDIGERIREFSELGIRLSVDGDQLRVRAARELMTDDIVAELKLQKPHFVDYLRRSASAVTTSIPVVNRAQPLPLSYAQQRLWFLDQFGGASSLYNITLAAKFKGQLNKAALERALREIVQRHEVLRTRVVADVEGQPIQCIGDDELSIATHIVESTEQDSKRLLRVLLDQEFGTAFDLAESLKIRAKLIDFTSLGEGHVLLVTMHHIATDGWSVDVFVRELQEFYSAFVELRAARLPELTVQYADYASWLIHWLNEARLSEQINYWRKQLADAPALIGLPTDHQRPLVPSYVGNTQKFHVTKALTEQLSAVGGSHGATLYMTLLSAFNLLLSRYSSEQDILVGTPMANRLRKETEAMIGFFVNTVVIRTQLNDELSFLQLLDHVRETTLSSYQHQEIPFEKLVEELKPTRSTSYSPLFQVMFILQNQPASHLSLPDVSVELLETTETTAKFDLTLGLSEADGELHGWINYSTDLFDAQTIERMSGHYVRLLESIVESPQSRISQLPMLIDSEIDQVVVQLNHTAMGYPVEKTLSQLISEQVVRAGDAVAVQGPDDTRWSYDQLESWSNRLARYLQLKGVGAGDRVGVYLERTVQMPGVLLGVMKSGAAYVPLDPMFPADRLSFMAEDAQLKLVLTQSALLGSVPGEGHEQLVLEHIEEPLSQLSDQSLDESHVSSAAYVIYTSGSTGQPKGVQVGHRALVNFLCSMRQRPGLEAGDRLLAVTTLSFDIAGLELYLPLITGACTVLASREESMDPSLLSARLSSSGATVMQATPASWKMLLDWGWQGDEQLKVLCGGEPLSRDLADRLLEGCGQLWNLYGPTETTIWSTVSQIEAGEGAITVGTPIGNTQVYVLDDQSQVVPLGVPGELYIGGDGVADGYLFREQLTAERFVADPFAPSSQLGARMYRTGDRVRWRADGELEVMGRLDDQVKLRGYRIEPGEIRAVLVAQSGVRDAVVVVHESDSGEATLVAYLVGDENRSSVQVSDLRDVLKQTMPEYMVPGAWVVLDKLPLTPNGKVDRKSLPAPSGISASVVAKHEAPQGELEERIERLWSSVLKLDFASVESSFFELGGHSLLAVRLVSEQERELGVRVSLLELFQGLTIRELAERIDQGASPGQLASSDHPAAVDTSMAPVAIALLKRDGPLPLSLTHERFLFLAEMYPEGVAYNIPLLFCLRGKIDTDAFEQAVHRIVERHEALRTLFPRVEDGQLIQVISEQPNHHFELMDVSDAQDPLAEAGRLAELEANRAFDLHTGPVLRVILYRCSDTEHVFCWVLHHIVSDGWSSRIFLRELHALYLQYKGGVTAQLPELQLQYADFGAWERAQLDQGAFDDQLAYWKERFATPVEALALPTDRVRPATLTYRGSTVEFTLSESLMQGLKALSRQRGVTLFTVLLSAYQILLNRYSGQSDICVGSPIARRTRDELANVYGCLISSVSLRGDLSGNPALSDLIAQTHRISTEAFANQDVPFEYVVEAVKPERNTSITPLFQAMFIFHAHNDNSIEQLGELEVSSMELAASASKFDVTLEFSDSGQAGWASLEYSTDLFDAQTIERMSGHYVRLLESIVESPQSRISQLPMLIDSEIDQVVVQLNHTAMGYPVEKTLSQLISEQVVRAGDAVAVQGPDDTRWSYDQLESWSNRLARYLQLKGVGAGDRVGVYLERTVQMPGVLLGVMKSGAAYVPLDPMFPADRLSFMAEDAQLKLVLTQSALLGSVPGEGHEQLVLEHIEEPLSQLSDQSLDESHVSSAAYVIYTSGSTGQPKGVQVGHRALVNFLCSMRQRPGLEAGDRLLAVTTLSFDIAGLELYLPLITGACTVLASREESMDPSLLSARLSSSGATVMQATPASWKMLLDWGWQGDEQLKVLCGGEPLSRDLADRLLEGCGQLWNLYGPTETTIWSTVSQIEAGEGAITVGTPIGNTQVYVLDDQSQVVPLGVPGELYIGGDGVADGYLFREQLTAERFVADPFAPSSQLGARMYRTGDRVRWRADGELEVMGRLDDQVKLRGYRIEPGEIRAVLVAQSGVRDAVVVVHESDSGEATLVAYLVGDENRSSVQVSDLRDVLKQTMPEYMVPGAWVVLDKLPLTPNGKVDRKSLPAPSGISASVVAKHEAPQGELEERIERLWSSVLKLDFASVESSFFELGGHSLLAVRLVSEQERELGVRVSLLELFQGLTIRELAERIDQGASPGQLAAPKSCRLITSSGNLTPLFMVGSNPRYTVASERLDDNQPVYQLDAYALHLRRGPDRKHAYNTIERIAEAFVDDIKNVQPEGPYMVGGGCEGALIAFEVALQLQRRGDHVVKLITWHTPPPGPELKEHFGGSTIRRLWWQLQTILSKGSIKELGIKGYRELIQHEYIEYSLFAAMFKYRPNGIFDGAMDAVLLDPVHAAEFEHLEDFYADEIEGWQRLVTNPVSTQKLLGNHDTWLRDHADVFGDYLEDRLTQVRLKGRPET